MKNLSYSFALLGLVSLLSMGCGVGVNRSLSVSDGQKQNGGLKTVNGKIRVGNDAQVSGNCTTVNGGISVGNDSQVDGLKTVNGSIKIGSDSLANGNLGTVNGSVTCEGGTRVNGKISTINGAIKLTNTQVDESLSTVNGDIRLTQKSIVEGDVKFTGKSGGKVRKLKLTLSDSSEIKGDVIVENSKVHLTIYLLDDSQIVGNIPDDVEVKTETQ